MSPPPKAVSLACALALVGTQAHAAFTERLKHACRAEYFAFCSAHAVGSASLRQCMRSAQNRLSVRCLKELVTAGEVSAADIQRYKGRKGQ
jgi:hypothetical protein